MTARHPGMDAPSAAQLGIDSPEAALSARNGSERHAPGTHIDGSPGFVTVAGVDNSASARGVAVLVEPPPECVEEALPDAGPTRIATREEDSRPLPIMLPALQVCGT